MLRRTDKARIALGLGVAVLGAAAGACGGTAAGSKGVEVVTAFYPLEFAVSKVGGSAVGVTNLTPPGVEPHDLELSPRQVGEITDAALVVYVGHGFQPAIEDAVAQIDDTKAIDALAGQDLLTPAQEKSNDVAQTIGDVEGDAVDPHVWLDPVRMKAIVDEVEAALGAADPSNKDAYIRRAEALGRRLNELDDEYSNGLEDCRSRDLVTSHGAFGYLADRYGLKQISVSGLDPQAEPSPGRLAAIARFVEEHGITTIFSEELAPPEIADTLAREAGVAIEVLSPLESAPASGDYFTVMKTNLDRIREALGCE